ncbi:hypothetical protein PUN28_016971 [Cardiocondyla obscurior]|uniref:Odorant receptor n=2 Tax=Cardiocondyla obscurior TaxID=286306 RepID=A0AAW2ENK6_9HYME
MNDKRLQMYRKYQGFIRHVLIISGCWYMPTKSGKPRYYWSLCVLLVAITYALLNMHASYFHRHRLAIMMKYIGITISAFGVILKVGSVLINRSSLIHCYQTLKDLFEEELTQNDQVRAIIFSPLPTIRILAYIYSAILIAMMMAFFMPAYLSVIRDLCHLHLTTNYSLPISRGYGYFWTVPNNFLYHFHLLFETSGAAVSSITACSMDSAFGFYVYQFASTMRAMTFRLTNPQPNEKFSNVLRTCVAKHQKLLLCRNTLEHVYGPIVFWHTVTNAVLLCALIYEMSSLSEINIFSVSISLTYGMIKCLQTFTYAWYGTILTDAGEDFRKGIYFGEWHNSRLDRHVRTNVILIMMQKPMTINAFFSSVDMIMFTNFVNTTVSYFFLLQSVGDKSE